MLIFPPVWKTLCRMTCRRAFRDFCPRGRSCRMGSAIWGTSLCSATDQGTPVRPRNHSPLSCWFFPVSEFVFCTHPTHFRAALHHPACFYCSLDCRQSWTLMCTKAAKPRNLGLTAPFLQKERCNPTKSINQLYPFLHFFKGLRSLM